jgi:hypothetical protein
MYYWRNETITCIRINERCCRMLFRKLLSKILTNYLDNFLIIAQLFKTASNLDSEKQYLPEERGIRIHLLCTFSRDDRRQKTKGVILTFVPCIFIICIMNQQMHNWSTIYCTALYYTAPTCFDAIASSSGSSQSVPAKLHKYVNAVLVIHFKTLHIFCCQYLKS